MRIVVVGPGAMGCLMSGMLAEAGHEVWLLDRNRERASRIASAGLLIENEAAPRAVRVNCTADASAIEPAEIVFLCVKAYDTGSAAESAVPVLRADTTVVSAQNGEGNVERIAAFVNADHIVCCSTTHGATGLAWGRIRHAGSGPTCVAAAVPPGRARAERVARLLSDSGFSARVAGDARQMIWGKLVINAAINPLAALWDVPNGALLERPDLRETMHEAALEAECVARAKGICLPYDDVIKELERVCRKTANNISSMLQDIRNGRRTEIDWITGVIVREGRERGIAAPANEALLAQVKQKERKAT